MPKRGVVLLSMVLALGLTAGDITVANATACVSRAEYRKIRAGMTKAEVKRLTGTRGTWTSATWLGDYYYESRMYKMCVAYSWASVIYIDGEVSSKSILGP